MEQAAVQESEPVTEEDHSHFQIISKRRLQEMQTRITQLESENQSLKSEIDSFYWNPSEIEAYERDI